MCNFKFENFNSRAMKKRYLSTILLLLVSISFVFAQNPKKLYKNAEKLVETQDFAGAIEQYNQAIELDASYTNAYFERGKTFNLINKEDEALADFEKVIELDPKLTDAYFNAAKIYYDKEVYDKALSLLNEATLLDRKFLNAIQLKIYTLIKLEDYENAVVECNKALGLSSTFIYHYAHGVASDSLGNYSIAEQDYSKAINLQTGFAKAYYALAKVHLKLNKLDDAIQIANKAVEKFPEETDAYLTRSIVFHQRSDYPSAINDLSKVVVLEPENEDVLVQRGIYYQEFSQHQNAINDFTKVLALNETNKDAYLHRAESHEEITKFDLAIADYQKFIDLMEEEKENSKYAIVTARLYELRREDEIPQLKFATPDEIKEGVIAVIGDAVKTNLKGLISDKSDIEYVKIEGKEVALKTDENGKLYFEQELLVENKTSFAVEVSDVYKNVLSINYIIERTEIDPPIVSLLTPYASDNGETYLEGNDPNLFIEGSISDENLIKEIIVDGILASFDNNAINPNFTANLDITNKNNIMIKATDIYGNVTEKLFTFTRSEIAEDNPMGKTWALFIENSNYESFASLDGPVKDVSEMKKALSSYKIHNIIHKKDLSKQELEKFFSIELRDLVKTNHVNSILVWYAGHGKFINETGYWIPVDATRDDEFTYFNINTLKASMQSYTSFITHTLVITDACESGPSFYQAMRSTPKVKSCTDYQATKFKSSQVFSSAGYELAVDNSQFTKTFAKSLTYNTDACMPIESIVMKVTEAVSKNNQQSPQFGKIAGFEDENGTFFFIKKD
jgi:tetratricopeptide (TPR) repeat protein